MTNEELVLLIKQGDRDKLEDLWQQISRFIWKCAEEFHADNLMLDLVQESYFGLLEAVEKYDYSKGYKFLTYAGYYIKNSMRRFMYKARPGVRLPEHMAVKVRKYDRFVSAFVQAYGREPTDFEAKTLLNMSDLKKVKAAALNPASLNSTIDDDGTEIADLQGEADPGYEEVLDSVFMQQLGRDLWGIVDKFPDQMRDVIIKYYCEGKTYKEIAEDLGVSGERVRAIKAKAMRQLRDRKELKQYYDDLYGRALTGSGVDSFFRTWTSSTERAAFWALGEDV